jgi:hypothetical protein
MSADRPRWVLRHRDGEPPEADLARIRAASGVRVVEHDGRVLLVEAREPALRALAAALPAWTVVPEHRTSPPRG